MEPWRVLVTDGLQDSGISILSKEAQVDDRKGISAEELLKEIGNYDAVIVRGRTKVTSEVIEAGKKLKVIGRAGVGVGQHRYCFCQRKRRHSCECAHCHDHGCGRNWLWVWFLPWRAKFHVRMLP